MVNGLEGKSSNEYNECTLSNQKRGVKQEFLLEAVLLVDAVPDLPRLRSSVACETLRVQQQVNILRVRRLFVYMTKNTSFRGVGVSL